MSKAIWNGTTIAESDDVLLVEFATYFPIESVAPGMLEDSDGPSTYCHWKGVAKYCDVVVDGERNSGAAWLYETPYAEAQSVAGRVAFWKGVEIEGKPSGEPMKDPAGPLGGRTGYEALCWLLIRCNATALSAAEILQQAQLDGGALAEAYEHRYAQPYIKRSGWRLVDGALLRS